MISLFLACIYFVGTHFLLSTHRIRTTLIARFGAKPFFSMYSFIAASGLLLMIYYYQQLPENPLLFVPHRLTQIVGMLGMYLAVLLLVLAIWQNRLTQKNTAVLASIAPPQGIYRVTRHPILIASLFWAISHTLMSGTQAIGLVAASFLVLNFFGIPRIDHRQHLVLGNRWENYLKETSSIPFVAILQKRNQMVWREFPPLAFIVTLFFYGVLYFLHRINFSSLL